MSIIQTYTMAQFDLAVLDTMHGDYAEYGRCLRFAIRSSAVEAVQQMLAANGACAFEDGERMTFDELLDWWRDDEQRRAA